MRQTSLLYRLKYSIAVSLVFLLCACEGGITGTGGAPASDYSIDGAVQKGPYVSDSLITIVALNADGTTDQTLLTTRTINDIGDFVFVSDRLGAVEIIADGYYFNEVTGLISSSTLELHGIYQILEETEQVAYVNVLTHIIHQRVKGLMLEGLSVDDALQQSQTELLTALGTVFPVSGLNLFTSISVYDTDHSNVLGNAYLLALSATFYQYAEMISSDGESVDSTLEEFLNVMSLDFGSDGDIDDSTIVLGLERVVRDIKPDSIKAHLQTRSSQAINEILNIPDIDIYIDTDGDGILNSQDIDDDNDKILDVDDEFPYTRLISPTVVAGDKFTCVLSVDEGQVVSAIECGGVNMKAQTNVPAGLVRPWGITAGSEHACVIDEQRVVCWGDNSWDQAVAPESVKNPYKIEAGGDRTCALMYERNTAYDNSRVECWGYDSEIPDAVVAPTEIAIGEEHICVIENEALNCWGDNNFNQIDIPLGINPVKLSSSANHTCVIETNGDAQCWGGSEATEIPVSDLAMTLEVDEVAAGALHTCILQDTTAICWGGVGSNVPPDLVDSAVITAGDGHSCALSNEAVLRCWGDSDNWLGF